MEKLLWFLTYISSRITFVILCVLEFFLWTLLEESGFFNQFTFNNPLVITLWVILTILCLSSAIWGGCMGAKYVELGRTRYWHYRSSPFMKMDNKFSNIIYWSGKFALLTINFFLILFEVWEAIEIIQIYK